MAIGYKLKPGVYYSYLSDEMLIVMEAKDALTWGPEGNAAELTHVHLIWWDGKKVPNVVFMKKDYPVYLGEF